MAIEQNSITKDLRPLILTRTTHDDAHIAAVTATAGRNVEAFLPNSVRDGIIPRSRPMFYPATVSDTGILGVGFGNRAVAAAWCLRPTGPVASDGVSGVSPTGFGDVPNFVNRGGVSAAEQVSNEGGEDSNLVKKVKFLCSFGGKILPRPSDGALRYVGGQTRIISVRGDVRFHELVQKMTDTCGQPVVIKYQLPDEDLDALVSVSCPEDLENMMEEYEKLVMSSSDGSTKLRVFLFSASEVDSSIVMPFGDPQDSGQRYVDAVNGIPDGVGSGGIMRKDSIASATSTQNSDSLVIGAEAVDTLSPGRGDSEGPLSPGLVSSRDTVNISQDTAPRLVYVNPNPVIYAKSSAAPVPLGIPTILTGHPQTLPSSRLEVELERTVPPVGQQQQLHHQQPMGFDLPRPAGMDYPVPRAYVQAYVDPQLANQVGYANPQLLGMPGSVYRRVDHQHQLRDNAAAVTHHQFIPAVHMTVASSSPHVVTKPNMVQHIIPPQQARGDPYTEESSFGQRMVQLPGDQNFKVLQAPAAPSQTSLPVEAGSYGWHPVPQPEHVFFSDGWVPHQQDHRDSISTVSDSSPVYHSLRFEDSIGAPSSNRVVVTGALGEAALEHPGAGAQPRVGHIDHEVGIPLVEAIGFSQNLGVRHDNERIILQKPDSSDHHRMLYSRGIMGLTGDLHPPVGTFMGNVPPVRQEDALEQSSVPFQYQIKQDALMNKMVGNDIPPVRIITSEPTIHEAVTNYSGKLPGFVSKEYIPDSCTTCDHLRPIDGRIETLRICCPEVSGNNEQSGLPVDRLRKDENVEHRSQLAGKEMLQGNIFVKPSILSETNHVMPIEMHPSSTLEVSHLHNLQPVGSNQVALPPPLGVSGLYPHTNIGTQHMASDEMWQGSPAYSGVDSATVTDGVLAIDEWKDEALQFQKRLVPSDAAATPSNCNAPSSSSPSNRVVGNNWDITPSNSLFSNQDPWSLRYDMHFPPPRPSKVLTSRETSVTGDPFSENYLGNIGESDTKVRLEEGVLHQPSGNVNKDSCPDHVRSGKGSSEEYIKKELQAVAEGVAASVLQSSVPSNPDLPVNEVNESVSESIQEREALNRDLERQNRAKVEDNKTKLSDMAPVSFPVSGGIGQLQIIRNSDLEELRELGSGTFGTVYHGKWRGSDVAIKRINDRCFAGKPSEQERMRDDFWNEAIKLADLHHPNVVAFYGVVLDGPGGSVATVTEYMVNGSLRNVLQKNDKIFDKHKRLLIAMDVAFGMEYLHGKNIVHFDLKSDNLLVNLRDPHRPICKVGDLGLSKVKCQTLISGGVRGTLPWMAPELLNGSSSLVSEKVDVFSFGIVMWEILTGEEPYADLHYGTIIGGIVSNTLRPPVPESCDPEWGSLMERSWSSEPSERPSFTEIADELRSMAANIPPRGQAQQQKHPQT